MNTKITTFTFLGVTGGGVSSLGESRSLIGASGDGLLLSSSWCLGGGGCLVYSVIIGGRGGGAKKLINEEDENLLKSC